MASPLLPPRGGGPSGTARPPARGFTPGGLARPFAAEAPRGGRGGLARRWPRAAAKSLLHAPKSKSNVRGDFEVALTLRSRSYTSKSLLHFEVERSGRLRSRSYTSKSKSNVRGDFDFDFDFGASAQRKKSGIDE